MVISVLSDSRGGQIPSQSDMNQWAEAINQVLQRFSDKDWNYSRISLILTSLQEIPGPYCLTIDWIDVTGKAGKTVYKTSLDEMTWGKRHSYELGILEIISLRLNHALTEITSDDFWHGIRPVLRLQKKEELFLIGQTHGFWHRVEEVQGEEFENR